jgi:hypothetical protein
MTEIRWVKVLALRLDNRAMHAAGAELAAGPKRRRASRRWQRSRKAGGGRVRALAMPSTIAMVMVHPLEFQPGLLFLLLDQFSHLALCLADIRMRSREDCALLVDVIEKLSDLLLDDHGTSPVTGL